MQIKRKLSKTYTSTGINKDIVVTDCVPFRVMPTIRLNDEILHSFGENNINDFIQKYLHLDNCYMITYSDLVEVDSNKLEVDSNKTEVKSKFGANFDSLVVNALETGINSLAQDYICPDKNGIVFNVHSEYINSESDNSVNSYKSEMNIEKSVLVNLTEVYNYSKEIYDALMLFIEHIKKSQKGHYAGTEHIALEKSFSIVGGKYCNEKDILKYVVRYFNNSELATDKTKCYNKQDLLKAMHYSLFELVRRNREINKS